MHVLTANTERSAALMNLWKVYHGSDILWRCPRRNYGRRSVRRLRQMGMTWTEEQKRVIDSEGKDILVSLQQPVRERRLYLWKEL